jgi:thiamine-phosphate pyrophosphorylase
VILCLVTDRRRLAGAAAAADRARACLVEQARHAAAAGIDVLQVRERDLPATDLAALVRGVVAVTRGSSTRVVVNDRLDVALACGADGVHLRGDSIDTAAVRAITRRGFVIGRSVHSPREASDAGAVDYLVAGTVFATASKPAAAPLLGIEGLAAIVRASGVPVLAIGGVTEAHMDGIARTGAAGCAAIGLFIGEVGLNGVDVCRAVPLTAVAARARRVFDTVKTAP